MQMSVKHVGVVPNTLVFSGWLAAAKTWSMQAWYAYSTRKALAGLDDRTLADLGISRAQARQEAARPFWDVRGLPS